MTREDKLCYCAATIAKYRNAKDVVGKCRYQSALLMQKELDAEIQAEKKAELLARNPTSNRNPPLSDWYARLALYYEKLGFSRRETARIMGKDKKDISKLLKEATGDFTEEERVRKHYVVRDTNRIRLAVVKMLASQENTVDTTPPDEELILKSLAIRDSV